MEIQPMSRNRRKIRSEIRIRHIRIIRRVHFLRLINRNRAIATTERKIVRAVSNNNGFGVSGCQTACAREAVQFAVCDGAFGRFREVEDRGSKTGGFEEADLVGDDSVGDEEAVVQAAEAERLVLVRKSQIESLQEEGLGGEVGGEAGEDGGVEGVWVLLCDGVGDDAAEGVAAGGDFLELVVAELAAAERGGQDVSDFDFEGGLDGLDGVWFVGFADAEAVVEEGCVAVFGGDVDVAVVGGEVPV
jgi:hypothetical protein